MNIVNGLLTRLRIKQRLRRLKNTAARNLKSGHIDSLEVLELIRSECTVRTIYDVGANVGTWSILARAIFPEARIIAFEPMRSHISEFENETRKLGNIQLYKLGLANSNTQMNLQVTSFSDASSILHGTALLCETYQISPAGVEEIHVARLDDLVEKERIAIPDLIKLDIQGYELEALKGGIHTMQQTKYILMEVSFVEMYTGQPLFEEVILFMNAHKFTVKAFCENTPTGRNLIQIDILFKNTVNL